MKSILSRMKAGTWLAIILILAVLVIGTSSLIWLQNWLGEDHGTDGSAATKPQSFVMGADALLVLKEQSGDISVYPSNSQDITVTPRKHGTLAAPDFRSVNIIYTRTHDKQGRAQLTITTDPWFSNIDFVVTMPATTRMQLTLFSGSIDVHTGHGLTASTGSGGIELDHVQGPIDVRTDSGDVTGNNLTGSLSAATSSGSVRLADVSGEVRVKAWSGDIGINGAALNGNSLLQTQNGSVHFDGTIDRWGSYTMQTVNGDVDLTLPSQSTFLLEASTASGTVQNSFGSTVVGSAPQPPLSLHTQHGSVTIVQA